jgi:PAS domain S-box-containing protein
VQSSSSGVLIESGQPRSVLSTQRKMEERLSALSFYGGKLNATNDLEQVYELTLDAMEQILGFEHASFLIKDRNNLKVVDQRGYPSPIILQLPLDGTKRGIVVKAANRHETINLPDVTKDEDYVEAVKGDKSELAVPVEAVGGLLGVLNVESRELAAFDDEDVMLLQILASHLATAISNLEERREIERRSSQFALLMKSSAEMIRSTDLHQRLQKIGEAIHELGWRRIVISVRDESMEIREPEDMVTVGLTHEEKSFLWNKRPPGQVWRDRFGPDYERFKIGEFYHLPWSDPWVREKFSEGTVDSKLSPEEMVDWDPQDLLYAPLRLAEGNIVGVLSVDDPLDGRKPTKESLAPLELFIHQGAVAIENARLIEQLDNARNQIKQYADHLEEKVNERTKDLRESEEKLKSIFATSPDGIIATDLNSTIFECNEQALKLYGNVSKKELIGKSILGLIVEKDRSKAIEIIKRTFEYGSVKNVEYTFLTKDGRKFPVELSASVIRDALGKSIGFVAVAKDITERKRMQEQLLKSERFAAIGEVAAMVGHDLRNPLTGIAGAAYYLKIKLGSKIDDKLKEMLDLIEKDIEYSNKIISDLLDYSREIRLDLRKTQPKSLIKKALVLAKVPGNVEILDLTKTAPKISVDIEQITRVFVNIIWNAVDAMPNGGKLTIISKRSGSKLEITFADRGTGMDNEILEKVWTPFFTTKAKGMGLGLSICKRIVEAHNGTISIESAVGRGTTVRVAIPLEPESNGGETYG